MSSNSITTHLRLFDSGGWVLPWQVAHQEGFFAEEGISVEFTEGERTEEALRQSTADLTKSYKETNLCAGNIDVYSACEWGIIKRVVELQSGKIIGNRRTVGMVHTIYVRENSGLNTPKDLAGVPIAVNFNSGSYFAAYEALENHGIPRNQIKLIHFGAPIKRAEALFTAQVEASSLMEPYSTLAQVKGFRPLLEYPGRGGWVGSEKLDKPTLEAFYRAVAKAVDKINQQPEKYKEQLVNILVKDGIDAQTIDKVRAAIKVPRYLPPEPLSREGFDSTYRWMVERELIAPNATYEQVVDTQLVSA
ncbi:hypothetical protein [Chlorogloeopsis sp. ULAP02]|uniref:ABC transporter substrate-binding protein n=1 Tax=Chlorogloeopsis sp. ULAP02 TaxID=3107926 RepID=UPI003134EC37